MFRNGESNEPKPQTEQPKPQTEKPEPIGPVIITDSAIPNNEDD